MDSEEEKVLEEKYVEELAKSMPQGTDKTPEILDSALSGLSSRYLINLGFSPIHDQSCNETLYTISFLLMLVSEI